MRIRHIKNCEERIENSSYIIKNPNDYKGKWSSFFQNKNSIHIEIGMGKGKFLTKLAINNPDINYIGIEKYDSVILRALEKQEQLDLKNLKFLKVDANKIEDIFDKEIEQIYLNFSDPWPKKRHEHRRLTSKSFLDKYDKICTNNYSIIQKTDNSDLFSYSLVSYNNNGYTFKELSLDLNDENNIETEYEEKFKKQGKTIYKVVVYKSLHSQN